MKKRIDIIASVESFHNLSTFNTIEEMNKTVRVYRDVIKTSVKRTDVQSRLITLLELLKRHSCKQIGVSYMSKNTIADKLELSYKTVQRLMKKLVELGMIRQVAMKRKKDMLQTSNAIIITPIVEEMSDKNTPEKSEKCPAIKTNTSSLKQKIKDINKRNNVSSVQNLDKVNFIAHWVPKQFAQLTSYFYSDATVINELWKVVRQNNKVVNFDTQTRAFNADEELNIALQSVKELVMKLKSDKRIKNIFGYFNGIVDNLMDKHFYDGLWDEML